MRWCAVIAALGVGCACSACGRLGFGGGNDDPVDAPPGTPDARPPARDATPIDTLSPVAAGRYDLSGTATPTGFTLTRTLLTGSDVFGVNLDPAMVPDSDWRVIKVGGNFIRTTVAWTGSMMTTTTASDPYTYVKRFAADLSSDTITDELAGLGGKTSLTKAGVGRWYWGLVDADKLHVVEIATDGTPTGPAVDVFTGGTGTPIAATLGGDDQLLFAVWSRVAAECSWATITPTVPPISQSGAVAAACNAPRVAAAGGGTANAVFDDGAMIWRIKLADAGATNPEPIHDGIAPRIVTAGGVDYVAFTASDGVLGVAVGTDLTALRDVPLTGLPNSIDAYELVAYGSSVILFVLGDGQTFWIDVTS